MMGRYGSLAVFLALTVAVSVAATVFEAGTWYYVTAGRPGWSPPPWLFGAAWALAWLSLALAGWQLRLSDHPDRRDRLLGWAALLVLAGGWFGVLFGLHRPGWSWLLLGILLALAVFSLRWFRPVSRQAAGLLIPFTAWIAFLWLWNLAFWTINGGFLLRLVS